MSSSKPVQIDERRRSTRIDRGIALIVKGVDIFKVPYQEFALTQAISFHGCRYETKHEVATGELVQLDVVHTEEGHPGLSAQGRVKRVSALEQRGRSSRFEIAVELNAPENVWGIANPPKDWLLSEDSNGDRIGLNHEIQEVRGFESCESETDLTFSPRDPETSAASSVSPTLVQFMTQFLDGLSAQTQTKATEAAALAFREEKEHWLAELRAEVQGEVSAVVERIVSAAKEGFVFRAKEAAEAQETLMRANCESWRTGIRDEMEDAVGRLNDQRSEIVEQLETFATSTMERMQTNADDLRQRMLDDTVSRLRSDMVSLIRQAEATIECVKTAEEGLKTNLLTASNTFQQFAQHEHERVTTELRRVAALLSQEFESLIENQLGTARKDLEAQTTGSITNAKQTFEQLFRSSETNAKQQFDNLIASASAEVNALQEKTRENLSKMEDCSRRQLQFVSELLSRFTAPDDPSSTDSRHRASGDLGPAELREASSQT